MVRVFRVDARRARMGMDELRRDGAPVWGSSIYARDMAMPGNLAHPRCPRLPDVGNGTAALDHGRLLTQAPTPMPRTTRLAGPGLGAAMGAATCATLWCLARSGRAAEIRRDLSTDAKEA